MVLCWAHFAKSVFFSYCLRPHQCWRDSGPSQQAAFRSGSPSHLLMSGITPPGMQNFAFPFSELQEVHFRPFLQPVHVSLNSDTSIWYYQPLLRYSGKSSTLWLSEHEKFPFWSTWACILPHNHGCNLLQTNVYLMF